MSMLDTFMYVFTGNADALKATVEEVTKTTDKAGEGVQKVDDAVDKMGETAEATGGKVKDLGDKAKKTADETKKLDERSEKLTSSLKGLFTGLAAAGASLFAIGAIKSSVMEASAFAGELGAVALELNVSTPALYNYGEAAKRAGGSVAGLHSTVKTLREGITDFRRTGGGEFAQTMSILGIGMRDAAGKIREPMDMLPLLAERFEKFGKIRQQDWGKRLGLDEGTILLLGRGRAGVEAMIKRQEELGTVTEKDARIAKAYNEQVEDTGKVYRRLALDAGAFLIPIVTRIYKAFEEGGIWIRKNQTLVTGFMIGVATIIGTVYLPAIVRAAIATWLWLAPYLAITAAVVALGAVFAFVFDDIMAYLDGGDSAIGRLIERFPVLGEVIKTIGTMIDMIAADAKASWEGLINMIKGAIQWATDAAGKVGGFVGKIKGFITSGGSDAPGAAPGGWMSVGGGGGSAEAPIGSPLAAVQAAKGAILQSNSSPLNSMSSTAISNSKSSNSNRSTSVKIDKVEVNTQATDADGISQALGQSLDRSLKQAIDSFDDGVQS